MYSDETPETVLIYTGKWCVHARISCNFILIGNTNKDPSNYSNIHVSTLSCKTCSYYSGFEIAYWDNCTFMFLFFYIFFVLKPSLWLKLIFCPFPQHFETLSKQAQLHRTASKFKHTCMWHAVFFPIYQLHIKWIYILQFLQTNNGK